ncbi:MAG: hypothetical protein AAFR73_11710 [Pseudomonadota bacterium]
MSLAQALDRAVSKALQSRRTEPKYRVFKDTGLDYVLCRKIPEVWERDAGASYDQLARIAGSKTCMAVNDIAAWDAELGLHIRRALDKTGVLDQFSNPHIIDTYTFISSSSGWTPFGAHVDFEHSLILGAGGAQRTIYTWDIGANIGQLKQDATSFLGLSFDYADRLQDANRIDLSPGDQAVIKALEGHVFYASGGGMFVGISCVEGDDAAYDHSPALAPTKDFEVPAFLDARSTEPLRWSDAAEIHNDSVASGDLRFMARPEAVSVAREIKSVLSHSPETNFQTCVNHFKGEPVNVQALISSCARIGAIYVS